MGDRPSTQQAQWLVSDYDFRIHAFYPVGPERDYLEALCQHSVPLDRIVRREETVLDPPHCEKCLVRFGEDLVNEPWRYGLSGE